MPLADTDFINGDAIVHASINIKGSLSATPRSSIRYVRVSTSDQNIETRENTISRYCRIQSLKLSDIIGVTISSRKDTKKRRIDELLDSLNLGDTLVVSVLSRLARSVGQIALMVDKLFEKKVRLIAIKEKIDLNGPGYAKQGDDYHVQPVR